MNPRAPHYAGPSSSNHQINNHLQVHWIIPATSTAHDVAMIENFFTNNDSFQVLCHVIPPDQEVITLQCLPITRNHPLLCIYIGDVDRIFSYPPHTMFWDQHQAEEEGRWFLFARKIRRLAHGYWKPFGPTTVLSDSNGVQICVKKCLVYYHAHPLSGTRSNWIMIEYVANPPQRRLFSEISLEFDNYVVCKIYFETNPDATRRLNLLVSNGEDENPSSVDSNEDTNEPIQDVHDQFASLGFQEFGPEQVVPPAQNPGAIGNQETNFRPRSTVQFQNNLAVQNPVNSGFYRVDQPADFPLAPIYLTPQAPTQSYNGRDVVWVPVVVNPQPVPPPIRRNPPYHAPNPFYAGRNLVVGQLAPNYYPQPLPPPVQGNPPPHAPDQFYDGRNFVVPQLQPDYYPPPLLPPVQVNPPPQAYIQAYTGRNNGLPPVPVYHQPLPPPSPPVNPPRLAPIPYSTRRNMVLSPVIDDYPPPNFNQSSVPIHCPPETHNTPPIVHVIRGGGNIRSPPWGLRNNDSKDSAAGFHKNLRKGG